MTGRGLSPRTVRYVHCIIRKALADAVAWGRLVRNPADTAKPPTSARATAGPPKAWNADQLRAFLRATSSDPEWPIWVALATTGARRGEILGLSWEDVDLEAGAIGISHSMTYLAGKVTLDAPKTFGSRRRVVLDSRTVLVLRRQKSHQAAQTGGGSNLAQRARPRIYR
jgi:integrase